MDRWEITLLDKKEIASDTFLFIFSRPDNFSFFPGQYIRIFHPLHGERIFRDFTISSIPLKNDNLECIIKDGISEYKKMLFSLPLGTKIQIQAPMGKFYFPDRDTFSHVFIAGGVGIAPFYSMLTYFGTTKRTIPITLFASFSSPQESIYLDELQKLAKQLPDFRLVISFTQNSSASWQGEVGRITSAMIQKYIANSSERTWWIAGAPSFVADMEQMVRKIHVPLEQIKTDIFLGY